MSVTQIYRALGSWSLKLGPNTPQNVLDQLGYFGHVAISAGRDNPVVAGDSLLRSARYVGVLRGATFAVDGYDLGGAGMALWLGDEDQKGAVIENLVTLSSSTFTNAVRSLLPSSGAVTEGTLHSVSGTYTGTHQYQSPREAIDYVCTTMGAAWRVNGDGSLDAGLESDLFVTTPVTAIVRRGAGLDMALRGLPGDISLAEDVQDFTTRVVLLAQGTQGSTATGSADIAGGLNPYKDVHGNTIKLTRLVSESTTDQSNATARAQLQLNRFTSTRDAVTLNSDTHDITGDVQTGDYVWVHDTTSGLVDLSNEITLRGQRLNPVKLQVYQLTWPVEQGMGVAYRDINGNWVDLTDYVVWETGSTAVTVGGYNRALTSSTSGEIIGSRPQQNTSIPNTPVFTTPFVQAVYQSASSGITKAQVQLVWAQPSNTDGTAIIDGDHYEIRYRTSTTPVYPSTWNQISAKTWSQLGTWDQPVTYVGGPWQYTAVGWDQLTFLVQELTPGIPYDFQIRAVDNGTPANVSAWSASSSIQTVADLVPPATPAAPTVAASRIAVQVTHTLGAASGGTYNLAADLHHLEIHAQYEPTFTPSDSTRLGKLLANNGMMIGQIPVIGTFPVESVAALYVKVIAVDEAGNKSGASPAATVTASLIDDAHISDLTVSKVTAGTILAAWILAGSIKTAIDGARMEADNLGLRLYNASNTNTVNLSAADGSGMFVGTVSTGPSGASVTMDPTGHGGALGWPSIIFQDGSGNYGFVNYAGAPVLGLNSGTFTNTRSGLTDRARMALGLSSGSRAILQVFVDATQVSDGGLIEAADDGAYIGYNDGTNEAFLQIDSNRNFNLKGQFNENPLYGGLAALFASPIDVPAGFGGQVTTYGATMAGRFNPVAMVFDASATNTYAAISAASATGCTVSYPNLHAVTVNLWVFRTDPLL